MQVPVIPSGSSWIWRWYDSGQVPGTGLRPLARGRAVCGSSAQLRCGQYPAHFSDGSCGTLAVRGALQNQAGGLGPEHISIRRVGLGATASHILMRATGDFLAVAKGQAGPGTRPRSSPSVLFCWPELTQDLLELAKTVGEAKWAEAPSFSRACDGGGKCGCKILRHWTGGRGSGKGGSREGEREQGRAEGRKEGRKEGREGWGRRNSP